MDKNDGDIELVCARIEAICAQLQQELSTDNLEGIGPLESSLKQLIAEAMKQRSSFQGEEDNTPNSPTRDKLKHALSLVQKTLEKALIRMADIQTHLDQANNIKKLQSMYSSF